MHASATRGSCLTDYAVEEGRRVYSIHVYTLRVGNNTMSLKTRKSEKNSGIDVY